MRQSLLYRVALAVTCLSTLLFVLVGPLLNNVLSADYEIGQDIQDKLGLEKDLQSVVVKIARYAIYSLSFVAVILIIYAGYTWMTAAGSEEKVSQAKKIITGVVIGIGVIILAWAIVTFVIGGFEGGSNLPES
ncbi:MAG: hypothetical protein PHH01_02860 [Patescibacteria group bacterium]|nr:hypothetical protein [Patescibacteria group bacterium]